jgi:small-conductance mechanosensitive channel
VAQDIITKAAPLLAGLGIGGLAVALALQSTLVNLFGGISLLSDGSLQVGDLVELAGGQRASTPSQRTRLLPTDDAADHNGDGDAD